MSREKISSIVDRRVWLILMGFALVLAPLALTGCRGGSATPSPPRVAVTGVAIYIDGEPAEEDIDLYMVDGYVYLTAIVSPLGATNPEVTWSVIQDYDTVSLVGSLVATTIRVNASDEPGVATVRVTTTDGGEYSEVIITVVDPYTPPAPGVASVTILGEPEREVLIGQFNAITLEAYVELEDGATGTFFVTWSVVEPTSQAYLILTPSNRQATVTGNAAGGPVQIMATAGGVYSEVVSIIVVSEESGSQSLTITFEMLSNPITAPIEFGMVIGEGNHIEVSEELTNARWYHGAVRLYEGSTIYLDDHIERAGRHVITVRADNAERTFSRVIAITAENP